MRVRTAVAGLLCLCCLLLTATVQAQGTNTAQEVREPTRPMFSRDGRQIVYVAGVRKAGELLPSSREIWIVNADGTNARRLTTGPADDEPRFSPDGRQVVFKRDNDLWLINVDGGELKNLTNTKTDRESGAEFTNDGQSLVFLRKGADNVDPKLKAQILRETPLAALGFDNVQSVVLRNLQTGMERVLLGDGYDVTQIAPVYFDDKVVFILCKPVDNDGKPVAKLSFDKEVAVLKLDGSLPRMVFQPKAGSKLRLNGVRVRPQHNIFEVDLADKIGTQVGLLQDGDVVLLPDAPIFGDVSWDGSTIVGTSFVGDKLELGIVLYDIATNKSTPLAAPTNAANNP